MNKIKISMKVKQHLYFVVILGTVFFIPAAIVKGCAIVLGTFVYIVYSQTQS